MTVKELNLLLISLISSILLYNYSLGCNEAVCASIVSKCMLTQSCKCDFKTNTTCSRLCYLCLDYLYNECCSCVEMCPHPNGTSDVLSSKSHVEDLTNPIPELFCVLTEEEDRLLRWKTFTFPVEIKFLTDIHKEANYSLVKKDSSQPTDGIDREQDIPVNCTVVYMSQCMSWNKCKQSCTSMGASSYRWFHDGCCECVGTYCVNYGINDSRCLQCPLSDEEADLQVLKEDQDYSEAIDSPHKKPVEEEINHNKNNGLDVENVEEKKPDGKQLPDEKVVEVVDKETAKHKVLEEENVPKKTNN